MMKKIMSLILIAVLVVGITGCSQGLKESDENKTQPRKERETKKFGGQDKTTGDTTYDSAEGAPLENGFTFSDDTNNKILEREGVSDGESYKEIIENQFIRASEENTSTFSIDVDTASYANLRNILSYGELPLPDAIRIEEMINYFDYDYETPRGDEPFAIHTKLAECPWESDSYVTMIGLKGKEIDREELPSSNIVLLLDVSGSMNEYNKLPLLKQSFEKLVDNLTEKDRVSIVVYAGASGVVLEGAEGSDKKEIMDALNNLQAGGSTAGSEGIKLAYKIAKKNFIKGGNNRVVLATDGDFNVGISSVDKLEDFIADKREDDIFLSVVGFGRGNIRDDIMETLADKGNGNYAYIDSLSEANKVFAKEFTGTMFAIAKDVKIQIEFNDDYVESYRLIGYENRVMDNEDFEDDTKDAGELGLGHEVTALYQIVPRDGVELAEIEEDVYSVKLRYKEPDEDVSKLIEVNEAEFVADIEDDLDLAFALAVAEFGMMARESEFRGHASIDFVKDVTRKVIKNDFDEYKEEFLTVVTNYEEIANRSALKTAE